jgi:ABC-type transport system substrate-binding protein
MVGWKNLGIKNRVQTVSDIDVYNSGFADGEFDLAWNFVTWTELQDPVRYLAEMKRISSKYVMLVTCNNFQPGYPWHRFLHKLYGFQWNHGNVEYNHITRVKRLFRRIELKLIEFGAIDTPGWPDPSGPRDVRLHRRFGSRKEETSKKKPEWEVPFIKYVETGNYPDWMKALGRWDMTFRRGVFKLPLSHLFYVLGEKIVSIHGGMDAMGPPPNRL